MDAATFLSRVLPPNDGYVNLHWIDSSKPRGHGMLGRAFSSVQDLVGFAGWVDSKSCDAYFACASQIRAEVLDKVNARGMPQFKAIRNTANARAMKALWMDIDVGKPGAYPDITLAIKELADFIKMTGVPAPTILVGSGSGLHVYWTMTAPIQPGRWKTMAEALKLAARNHGLKQDPTRTADPASVLRIPDTKNWKDPNNPKLVYVMRASPTDIAPDTLELALKPFVTVTTRGLAPGMGDMTAGLSQQARPVDLASVLPSCEVLRTAAETGGADYEEPLWYQTIRAATYAEDGREWAHKLSNGHPKYDPVETDKKFDHALTSKDQNDLGWPKCSSFASHRPDVCKACPRFAENRSPLNFRTGADAIDDGSGESGDLPKGYYRHSVSELIFTLETMQRQDADGVEEVATPVPVLDYKMWQAELTEEDGKAAIRFRAQQREQVRSVLVTVAFEKLGDNKATIAALNGKGVMVSKSYHARIREFLVSWVKKLQAKESVRHPAFGWVDEGENIIGFSYGGACHTKNGELPVLESKLDAQYRPVGEAEHWIAASKALCATDRVEIDAILATAFASPLIRFTEQRGVVMSFVGESGAGKTTAIHIALSVWGNPHKEKNSIDDTVASMSDKLGILRSLPAYWDEVRNLDEQRAIASVVFRVAEGKEKSRMTGTLERREGKTWNTMLMIGSNLSILEEVADASPESSAGLMRVVEIRVPRLPDAQLRKFAQMDETAGKAMRNYGHAGLIYAKHLGANAEEVRARLYKVRDMILQRLKCEAPERLWAYSIASLLVGAELSVKLGLTTINVQRLAKYLIEVVFPDMRAAVPRDGGAGTKDPIEIVADYLRSLQPHGFLITDASARPGNPPRPVLVRNDIRMLRRVEAHYIEETQQLRVSRASFTKYLRESGIYRRGFTSELEARHGARFAPLRLGAGTPYAAATSENCLLMNLGRPELASLRPTDVETAAG